VDDEKPGKNLRPSKVRPNPKRQLRDPHSERWLARPERDDAIVQSLVEMPNKASGSNIRIPSRRDKPIYGDDDLAFDLQPHLYYSLNKKGRWNIRQHVEERERLRAGRFPSWLLDDDDLLEKYFRKYHEKFSRKSLEDSYFYHPEILEDISDEDYEDNQEDRKIVVIGKSTGRHGARDLCLYKNPLPADIKKEILQSALSQKAERESQRKLEKKKNKKKQKENRDNDSETETQRDDQNNQRNTELRIFIESTGEKLPPSVFKWTKEDKRARDKRILVLSAM